MYAFAAPRGGKPLTTKSWGLTMAAGGMVMEVRSGMWGEWGGMRWGELPYMVITFLALSAKLVHALAEARNVMVI